MIPGFNLSELLGQEGGTTNFSEMYRWVPGPALCLWGGVQLLGALGCSWGWGQLALRALPAGRRQYQGRSEEKRLARVGEDMFLGRGGPRLPVFSPMPCSCRQCQQDAALWQTLHLDQSVSLDELLNISQVSARVPGSGGQSWGHRAGTEGTVRGRRCGPSWLSCLWQYTGEVSTAFEKVNITLSPISLLSQDQGDLLLNASRAGQPPNFTLTLEQVGWGQPGVGMGGSRCVLRGSIASSPLLLWESHHRLPGCSLSSMSSPGATGHLLHLGGPGSALSCRGGVCLPTPHRESHSPFLRLCLCFFQLDQNVTQGSLLDLAAELEELANKAVRDRGTSGPRPPCPQSPCLWGLLCRSAWVPRRGRGPSPSPSSFLQPGHPHQMAVVGQGPRAGGALLTAAPPGRGRER